MRKHPAHLFLSALAYGGFSYTKEKHEAKIGPLQFSITEKDTINIPVWAGVGAIGIGVGLAGGSFAVGVAYVSRFFPAAKQGTALGIFGVGNVGAAVTKLSFVDTEEPSAGRASIGGSPYATTPIRYTFS